MREKLRHTVLNTVAEYMYRQFLSQLGRSIMSLLG